MRTLFLLPLVAIAALPFAPRGAQSAPLGAADVAAVVAAASDDALTAFAAGRRAGGGGGGGGGARAGNVNRGASHTNLNSANLKSSNLKGTNLKSTNIKSTNVKNTNIKNVNVKNNNINVNKNVNVNRGVGRVGVAAVRPWVRRPYYGTVVAGVALGTIIAVSSIPPAPSSDLCWYWSNSSQTQGYWDYCQ